MQTTTIGKIAKVKGGKRLPKGFLVQDDKTPYPYLRVTDFGDDGLNEGNIKYITESVHNRIKRYTITNSDVYISIAGTIGLVGIVPDHLSGANLTENAAKICEVSPDYSPRFIMYYLRGDQGQAQIKSKIVGTSQPKLALFRIQEIEVPCIPRQVQDFQANILFNYDLLISNNLRRIQILEEIASAIYREWFIHFRFPGHEDVRMVESELELIPEGWDVVTIQDVTRYINRGISPKYDENADSWVINQKCIRNNQLNLRPARRHTTAVSDVKKVRFGDVLINSTGVGTLGRVTQVYQELPGYTVDSHVTIARPNERVTFDYFGYYLLGLQEFFVRMGFGATNQTELGRATVAGADFLLPPLPLQQRFREMVEPIRNLIVNLQKRNDNLRQQRDLLLPRLISGEIEV